MIIVAVKFSSPPPRPLEFSNIGSGQQYFAKKKAICHKSRYSTPCAVLLSILVIHDKDTKTLESSLFEKTGYKSMFARFPRVPSFVIALVKVPLSRIIARISFHNKHYF